MNLVLNLVYKYTKDLYTFSLDPCSLFRDNASALSLKPQTLDIEASPCLLHPPLHHSTYNPLLPFAVGASTYPIKLFPI